MKAQFLKFRDLIVSKFNKYVGLALSAFPTALPRGLTEFNLWSQSIIDTFGLPDNDSVRFMLATMVLHLDSTSAYKPKLYFGFAALKSMSNQVAAYVVQEEKRKQQERIEAEKAAAKQQAEATAEAEKLKASYAAREAYVNSQKG